MWVPEGRLHWPNLRVNFGHGSVDRGGMTLPDALPARQRGQWLLPETGKVIRDGDQLRYDPAINMRYQFKAWQESLDDIFFVEFIIETDSTTPEERLIEGRRRLGPLKTMIELRFGPRVLGLRLTEEIGEVFPDGHFNRELASDLLGAESQYDVAAVMQDDFFDWARGDVDQFQQRPKEEIDRIRLACDWYWQAMDSDDPVDEYLSLWFVVETLAMPNTTNTAPVRDRLAAAVGGAPDSWKRFVGHHYRHRSALVHGGRVREVAPEPLADLRALVEALLQDEMSKLDDERRAHLEKLRDSY